MSFNGNYFCTSYSNDRSFKMCWFLFCQFLVCSWKENVTQITTVKMRSRSSDTFQTDIYTLQWIYRPNILDLSLIVIEKQICSWKCDTSHWTVKMRSRSSDTCQTDMYTLQCIYRPNIDDLSLTVIEKQTCSWKCDTSHWTVKMRSRPIRNKNCSWQPCLSTEWNQMKKLYRRSYIPLSLIYSVNW